MAVHSAVGGYAVAIWWGCKGVLQSLVWVGDLLTFYQQPLQVAQRTNAFTNTVVGRTWVVGRDIESHVHHENAFEGKVNFLMSRI